MTNAGNKKLLVLLLTIVLLAAGLIAMGSTFATQVTLTGEETTLTDADFKVSVKCYDGSGYNTHMLANVAVFTDDTYWCPGQTQIVYFAVENKENFPVQTTMDMVVSANGFDDMLRYAVIKDVTAKTDTSANWSDFTKNAGSSSTLTKNTNQDNVENPIFSEVVLASGDIKYFALAIHMQEEASSHYQNKELQMKFRFRVDADYTTGVTPAEEAK